MKFKTSVYKWIHLLIPLFVALLLQACAGSGVKISSIPLSKTENNKTPAYLIGSGDVLNIFVWGNDELSTVVPVRPDGRITTPLVEDVQASGRTPTQLARDIEKQLAKYVKKPVVTITVTNFIGRYSEQIRVVGEAAQPMSLSYTDNMTLLDVMIAVGGLTEFAAGNRASIIRKVNGEQQQISIRIDDLIRGGDITANFKINPGDIIIIPESLL